MTDGKPHQNSTRLRHFHGSTTLLNTDFLPLATTSTASRSMFSPVCFLAEKDIIDTMAPALRIGYVPEHFSTPLYFAKKHFGLDAELIPFPSGTGHMVTALRAGDIDVGIGLTEGWIAGLGKTEEGDGGYRLVGTYVETPLCEFDILPDIITRATDTRRLGHLHW